jgi:hypothetical protein
MKVTPIAVAGLASRSASASPRGYARGVLGAIALGVIWLWAVLGTVPACRAADAPAVAPAVSATATDPDLHTFTNQDGRTIKAKVLSVVDDTVNLQRDDGQSFNVKISIFSKDDLAYIGQWVAKQAVAQGGAFEVTASSQISPSTSISNATTGQTMTQWKAGYSLTLKNLTTMNWANLKVRYVIFKLQVLPGEPKPDNIRTQRLNGEFAVDSVDALDDKTFPTDKIPMQSCTLMPNFYYANGADAHVTDALEGVWIRIYDSTGAMLQEWCSSSELMKKESFETGVHFWNTRGGNSPPPEQ